MVDAHDDGDASGVWARETAPQSDFSMGSVWLGLAVLVVGLLLTFGLALLLA